MKPRPTTAHPGLNGCDADATLYARYVLLGYSKLPLDVLVQVLVLVLVLVLELVLVLVLALVLVLVLVLVPF